VQRFASGDAHLSVGKIQNFKFQRHTLALWNFGDAHEIDQAYVDVHHCPAMLRTFIDGRNRQMSVIVYSTNVRTVHQSDDEDTNVTFKHDGGATAKVVKFRNLALPQRRSLGNIQ
jgi:hypothetical protein